MSEYDKACLKFIKQSKVDHLVEPGQALVSILDKKLSMVVG